MPRQSTAERFWAKVNKTEGCWLWTAYIEPRGYGVFSDAGKKHRAHRMAWRLVIGEPNPGLTLDHLCRVKHCVRPDHMEEVTAATNTMRGDTITARNAAKTHCLRGHELNSENTYTTKKGYRQCLPCRAIRRQESGQPSIYRREKRKRRLRMGLCASCGVKNDTEYTRCRTCLDQHQAYKHSRAVAQILEER